MNLLIISKTDPDFDFRKYLMQAALGAGDAAALVSVRDDGLQVVDAAGERFVQGLDPSKDRLSSICRELSPQPGIILNSCGAAHGSYIRMLKERMPGWIVGYDVFDQLSYGARGAALVEFIRRDIANRRTADFTVVLSRRMRRYYPFALHLDNASHLPKLQLPTRARGVPLVAIGSLDDRVDFGFLAAAAAAAFPTEVHLYGYVHADARSAAAELEQLVLRHPNVRNFGAYRNDDLPRILANYRIGLLPYKVGHPLTRFINPDKLHHYLNAGLEVISTRTPAAKDLAGEQHLTKAGRLAEALENAYGKPRNLGRSAERRIWPVRWLELKTYVAAKFPAIAD